MHINEQSPRGLKKQLSKFFPYVHIWLSSDENMGDGLIRSYKIQDYRKAKGVFAIASHRPINIDALISVFNSKPFDEQAYRAIEFAMMDMPKEVKENTYFDVLIKVKNRSHRHIVTLPPHPYHLSYHWRNEGGDMLVWDGLRTSFTPRLPPNAENLYKVRVQSPAKAGHYHLEVAAVQELVRWHEPIKSLEIIVQKS